jgi:hypothetical protein
VEMHEDSSAKKRNSWPNFFMRSDSSLDATLYSF